MEFTHRPSPFLVKMLGLGPGNIANWRIYPRNSSTLEAQVLNVLHNTFRYKLENSEKNWGKHEETKCGENVKNQRVKGCENFTWKNFGKKCGKTWR